MSYGLFQHSGKTTTLGSGARGVGGKEGQGGERRRGKEKMGGRVSYCALVRRHHRPVWLMSNHHALRITVFTQLRKLCIIPLKCMYWLYRLAALQAGGKERNGWCVVAGDGTEHGRRAPAVSREGRVSPVVEAGVSLRLAWWRGATWAGKMDAAATLALELYSLTHHERSWSQNPRPTTTGAGLYKHNAYMSDK